jgi:hypothetical protein
MEGWRSHERFVKRRYYTQEKEREAKDARRKDGMAIGAGTNITATKKKKKKKKTKKKKEKKTQKEN